MVTYARKKSQNQYITADTEQGEKILKYLKSRCEKALNYCQEQGLTAVEDFAEAVEELTEADGKPGISVKVTQGGFVLSLTDRPEYGSTTGKYMMEHLGEPDDTRFTAAGIKAILSPEKSKSKKKNKPRDLDELLSDIEESDSVPKAKSKANSHAKNKLELDELNLLDEDPDILDRITGSEPKIKTQAKSQTKSNSNWERADSPRSKSQAKSQIAEVEVDEEFVVDELEEEDKERTPKTKSQAKSKTKNRENFVTAEIDGEEEIALPQQVKPKSRQDEEELAGETESQSRVRSKNLNRNQPETADSSIDDLLDSHLTKTPSTQSLQYDGNPRTQRRKKPNESSIDSLLKTGAQISERVATSGNEVDGTTFSGLSAQAAFLATIVGIDAAQKVVDTFRNTGQERQVSQLIKRLKVQSQRADELAERANNLPELIDEQESETSKPPAFSDPEPKPELRPNPHTETETSESAGSILAKAVNQVTQKVEKAVPKQADKERKINPIEIDTKASLEEQLKQINQALDRLEKRLDALESRIESLENALQEKPSPNKISTQTTFVAEAVSGEKGGDFVNSASGDLISPNPIRIVTDGACSGNTGASPGGWAAIINRGETATEIGGRDPSTTNNRMELVAIIEGLKSIPPDASVHIVTDSEYAIKGCTEWMENWVAREWKTSAGKPVENRDLWEQLKGLVGDRVSWEQVQGHSGHPENERVDAIASAFARGENPLAKNSSEIFTPRSDRSFSTDEVGENLLAKNSSEIFTPRSDRSFSTDEALVAEALVQIYNAAVEEAVHNARDRSQVTSAALEGGIDLGNTKLYVIRERELTTVSMETKDSLEVFAATSDETGEWNVTADKLTPKDKQEILNLPRSLEAFQQGSNRERLAFLVASSGKDAISLTDYQGNKFEFETEAGIVTGYTEHGEVIYEAIIQPEKIEVLQCDIPASELESLLELRQQSTQTSNSHRETQKPHREIEI